MKIPTNCDLRKMALDEYNSDVTTAHHGFVAGGTFWNGNSPEHNGQKSRPFWNAHATQFIFNPAFEFPAIPDCRRFLFTAVDCNQKTHTFEADTPMSLLTPIWGELPEGYVQLKVEALENDGTPICQVGARTFWRGAPFGGPDAYPPKAHSYRECALMAYRYVYNMPSVQYWLEHGVPDPTYGRNTYITKMASAIIGAMTAYAKLEPENAENAIQLAKNAADYVLSITICGDSPLAGLPPTYYSRFRTKEQGGEEYPLEDMVMMFYPADMGMAYLMLEEATGEERYYEAAWTIAEYYRTHVLENGTWYLMCQIADGENRSANYCLPDSIIPFMKAMYKRTGEEIWMELMKNAHAYRKSFLMESYEWEGQFEDSPTSAHYSNMSHYPADSMINYIAENQKDDPAALREAEELMRFVEDQFVVWGRHAERNRKNSERWILSPDKADWHSPAGLEQYSWYVPIDASTVAIMSTFLHLYKANGNPLLLAKACALADSVTNMQNPETGMIPTHWTTGDAMEHGGYLWLNCVIETARCMLEISNETETHGNA